MKAGRKLDEWLCGLLEEKPQQQLGQSIAYKASPRGYWEWRNFSLGAWTKCWRAMPFSTDGLYLERLIKTLGRRGIDTTFEWMEDDFRGEWRARLHHRPSDWSTAVHGGKLLEAFAYAAVGILEKIKEEQCSSSE